MLLTSSNLEYGEMRRIVLGYVLSSQEFGQYGTILSAVAKRLVDQGFCKETNSYSISFSQQYLDLADRDANLVNEIVWDLIIERVLAIGMNKANPSWPFLRLTEYGKSLAASGENVIIHDVDGMVGLLKTNVPDLRGYHIFISKFIPMAIMVGQYGENLIGMLDTSEAELLEFAKKSQREKNKYLRMIRHELAHVEDGNNQNGWTWLESAFQGNTVKSTLRYDAFRLWEEYYACRRSNFFYDVNATTEEVTSLLSNLEEAEAEICDLRWKYNNGEITLDEFVQLLHEYIRLAFIYCCYFMGHTDGIYEYVVDKLQPELYPSRFYRRVSQMWGVLRTMADSYPNWSDSKIFDDLSAIIFNCIVEFEIYPEDTPHGIYVSAQ